MYWKIKVSKIALKKELPFLRMTMEEEIICKKGGVKAVYDKFIGKKIFDLFLKLDNSQVITIILTKP